MAEPTLSVLYSSEFPQVFDGMIQRLIARAIVHLNFNEPDEARDVLLGALAAANSTKGDSNVDSSR